MSGKAKIKAIPALAGVIIFCVAGCHNQAVRNFTDQHGGLDLTNDLHHRIKAGLLLPDKEPITLILMGHDGDLEKPAPGSYARFSWDGGTFWVKADDLARVNVYCNRSTVYGHIQIAGGTGSLGVQRDFFENPTHPVRPIFVTTLVDPISGTESTSDGAATFSPGSAK